MRSSARGFQLGCMALLLTVLPSSAQDLPWQEREYGIGVVRYEAMYRYDARDIVRAAPFAGADTVATLTRDSLCFRKPPGCVRSYDRMIEFDYEVPGWAILEFSGDSTWVKVRLAPAQTSGAAGWVRLRPDSVTALLWSGILPKHRLFFLRESHMAFYEAPVLNARVNRRLATRPGSAELNYIMNPLAVRGTWLRVELLSPSPYCESDEIRVAPDTVWIQYLTDRGRPQVFFHTRGC